MNDEININWKLAVPIFFIIVFTISTYFITKEIIEKQMKVKMINQLKEGIKQCNMYCIKEKGYSYKGFIESFNDDSTAECWCIYNAESTRGNQTELSTENN